MDAYVVTFGNLKAFFAIAAIPIAITAIVLTAVYIFFGQALAAGESQVPSLWGWFWWVLNLVLYVAFAVGWHRFVLLGQRDTASPIQFRWGRRGTKFAIYFAILSLLYMVGGAIVIGMGEILGPADGGPAMIASLMFAFFISSVAVAVVWIRCIFVFPAIAVDERTDLRMAWEQSKGVSWRLFGMLFVAGIPLMLGFAIVASMFFLLIVGIGVDHGAGYAGTLGLMVLVGSAQSLFGFVSLAITVAIVSLAFKRQTSWEPR